MTIAKLHIRAKNQEIWDACWPLIKYYLAKSHVFKFEQSQCGMEIDISTNSADRIYYIIGLHKIPVTIDMQVDTESAQ